MEFNFQNWKTELESLFETHRFASGKITLGESEAETKFGMNVVEGKYEFEDSEGKLGFDVWIDIENMNLQCESPKYVTRLSFSKGSKSKTWKITGRNTQPKKIVEKIHKIFG